MNRCSSLYFLSTIACRLAECLSEDELNILSADLSTLGDMLESIAARQSCASECKTEPMERSMEASEESMENSTEACK